MEVLTAGGKMTQAGLDAFAKRKGDKSSIYAYEKEEAELTDGFRDALHANKDASAWFYAQAPGYRRTVIHWVMNAKQEATRVKRMNELITDSAAGRKIKSQRY
jgi:uncharacterized protein YdeI (YjbR/CyaY-like superfamily)